MNENDCLEQQSGSYGVRENDASVARAVVRAGCVPSVGCSK